MLILIAEDLDDARQATKLLLAMKGYEVLEAVNGLEAVEIATRRKPDLILMDLNMPVLDGIAAMRYLRDQPATAETPIIAVTAHSGDGNWREQARAAGCTEYLAKPLDFERLLGTIEQLSRPLGDAGHAGDRLEGSSRPTQSATAPTEPFAVIDTAEAGTGTCASHEKSGLR